MTIALATPAHADVDTENDAGGMNGVRPVPSVTEAVMKDKAAPVRGAAGHPPSPLYPGMHFSTPCTGFMVDWPSLPPTAIVATGVGDIDAIELAASDEDLLESDEAPTTRGRAESGVVVPSAFPIADTGLDDTPVTDDAELEAPPRTVTGASDGSMEQRTETSA